MPKRPTRPDHDASRDKLRREVGYRLRLVRRVLDMTQADFCRPAGIASNAYSMIESGERLPSIEVAIALCHAYRISMDWIFRGEPGDMSARLWDGIRSLMAIDADDAAH
jgi:DNA-binding XRE family transcriptional regulator